MKETIPSEESNMEERILAEAEKLFFEKGFAATSTTEIARQAGCNQTLVHYYFRTKENLFTKVLGGKVKRFFNEFLSVNAGEGDFETKLARVIGSHFDIIRQNSHMTLLLIAEFTRDPQRLEELKQELGELPSRLFGSLEEDLSREIAAGRIRKIEFIDLLINIISLNAFLFVVKPLYMQVCQQDDRQMQQLFDHRKEEIIRTILSSLRP